MMRQTLWTLFFLFSVLNPAISQSADEKAPGRAEVLVLGVYHMSNPGHDIFNTKADDVLAPKRQAEMMELMEVLKRFHPTKIAVEADVWSKRIEEKYSGYLAGTYTLTSNEVDQIGFRLAKELGHKKVYPVDVDGEFPYPHLVNYAKASGRSKDLDELMSEVETMVKDQNAYLLSHTVLETLLYMNNDSKVADDVGFYFRQAHFGEPGDWAGADLVADWFRRNMRIYSNITNLVESAQDRILVIYGAGHLGWLQYQFGSDPSIRLRKLAEFTNSAGAKKMNLTDVKDFATRYTAAWCSQDPARVASFFSEDGSIAINGGSPNVGRAEITRMAQGFMTAFPDMIVKMDDLQQKGDGFTFHWTLIGTNSAPGGTGKRVHISGYEEWTIGVDGLIKTSLGHFDDAEYQRQLEFGTEKAN